MVDRIYNAVTKAKQLGTFNEMDRARQYQEANTSDLLRSLNEAWSKIRLVEAANVRKDAEIAALHQRLSRYRVAYTVMVSIVTGLAWEGLKMLLTLVR